MSAPTDIGTALQTLVTNIIDALAALFNGFAVWIQQNASTLANILGWVVFGAGMVYVVVRFGRQIYDFIRGLAAF